MSGKAYVYTYDGSQNIRNPIIVAEGFDPTQDRRWRSLYNIMNRENFLECMKLNGYDFIVCDFDEGGTYIERNAYLFKALIEEINTRKVTKNKNIVLGASMGGLVARYALAYMERNSFNHDTRLYVSFDSPHKGANIPLGTQYWAKFFRDAGSEDARKAYDDKLKSIAAQQLLVYHAEHVNYIDDNPNRLSFTQNLFEIGFPNKLRKIAIANGSGNSTSLLKNDGTIFNPREQIIEYSYRNLFFADIDGHAWAVPDFGPSTTIFKGLMHKKVFIWNALNPESQTINTYYTEPYDNAPGGTFNTMEDIANSNPKFIEKNTGVTINLGDIKTNINNHAFIPTISSLAINTDDLFYNIAADPNILERTPFNNIFYPSNNINQKHVEISNEAVTWMKNELVPQNVLISPNNGNQYWNNGEIRALESITIEGEFATTNGAEFSTNIHNWQDCSTLPPYTPYNPDDLKGTRIDNQYNIEYSENKGSIANLSKINNIEIYPNPNNGLFSIKINSLEDFDYLEIVNAQGTLLNKQINVGSANIQIDISNYPNGIFFIVSHFKGISKISKIIKNN